MLLSDDEIAHLVKYYQTVQLSGEQKDRLIQRYWEATPEERRIIATVYASLFARDGAFVQRLVYYHDTKLHHAAAATSTPTVAGSSRCGRRDDGDRGISTNGDPPDSSGLKKGPPLGQTPTLQFTHAQLLLRTAIQDKFPKFVGNGPFPIEFGVVRNEEERREVIAMYSTQFQYPDPPELHRLVTLPQSLSTRTRRRANGSYTFYIRSLSSTPYAESRDGGGGDAIGAGSGMTGEDSHCRGEIACAVTLIVHNYETRQFAEMPLFATGVGYKKNGLGRLLNACVLEWCRDQKCEFIMISADVQAVPFWQHCGYAPMSRNEKNRIAFYYDNYCFKFHGAEAMIGYLHQRVERRRGLPTPTAYTALKGGGEPATEPSAESDSSRKRPRPAGGAFPFEAEQFQLYDGADIESGDSEVAAALRLMPRFVVQGPIRLPDP